MYVDEHHSCISAISKSHVGSASVEEMATDFDASIKTYTAGLNCQFFLYNTAIAGSPFLILLVLFPVFINFIHSAMSSLMIDICILHF